jgi:hypothetical protein
MDEGSKIVLLIACMFVAGTCTIFLVMFNMDWIAFQTDQELTAVCHLNRDIVDNQTVEERHGNRVELVTRYHVYDMCKTRNGTVVSNTSVGYLTFDELVVLEMNR